MRYFRYIWVATLIIVAFLVVFPKLKEAYNDIPSLFKAADKSLIVFLLIFQGLNYLGGGWLFQTLSAVAGFKVRLVDTIKISVLSVVGTHIAPFFGGSIVTFYAFKKLKLPAAAISFLIPAWTFFTLSIYVLFFVISLVLLPSLFFEFISLKNIVIIFSGLVLILAIATILFKGKGKYLVAVANKFTGRSAAVQKLIADFFKYLNFLPEHRHKILPILLSSFLFYAGDIATLYFAFLVFGFHPNFILLILGYALSLVLTAVAIIPGTPGVLEASLMIVFVKLGFPAHIVVFASLLFRLFTYWLPLPIGALVYWRLKNKLK